MTEHIVCDLNIYFFSKHTKEQKQVFAVIYSFHWATDIFLTGRVRQCPIFDAPYQLLCTLINHTQMWVSSAEISWPELLFLWRNPPRREKHGTWLWKQESAYMYIISDVELWSRESNGMTDQRNAITNKSRCPIKKRLCRCRYII